VIGKLYFTGYAYFTFAKQKLHFAENYRATDIKNFLWW